MINPTLLVSLAIVTASDNNGCPFQGWNDHQIELVTAQPESVINNKTLPGSFFGIEGGHMVRVGSKLYTVITEFNAPPLWVPSHIALWQAEMPHSSTDWPTDWTRIRTLFTSGGKVDCQDPRASLGSSAAIAFDNSTNRWNVFYVGFKSCNDSSFVNRDGRIYRAQADVEGVAGITSTYTDLNVVIDPDHPTAQPWEGTQGDDSMQPYYLGPDKGWASFYGSAGVTPSGVNNGQKVGLALAPNLAGPWTRASTSTNPVNLSAYASHIEQPIVTKIEDSSGTSFVAFFDALGQQGQGDIGYSWSPDGVTWDPQCSQLINVLDGDAKTWAKTGNVRTPQGVVVLPGGEMLLGFSAYDFELPPYPHLPSQKGKSAHESMGMAKLRFKKVLHY